MHDSQRYRYNAAECLRAAQQARNPVCSKVHLSMALSWLSLARQDEAMDAFVPPARQYHPPPKPTTGESGNDACADETRDTIFVGVWNSRFPSRISPTVKSCIRSYLTSPYSNWPATVPPDILALAIRAYRTPVPSHIFKVFNCLFVGLEGLEEIENVHERTVSVDALHTLKQ
jgi:hypothetical protein